MKKYQYILFDMDGTLIDSEPGILASLKETLKILGIEKYDANYLRKFLGPPLKESFMSYLHMEESEAEAAVKIFRDRYSNEGIHKSKLYEGIKEILVYLFGKYNLFIATSKPTPYTEVIAKELDIHQYFRGIVGSNLDNSRGKKGEVIQYILDKFFILDKSQSLMIGDKAQDLIGARECGIDAAGVSYGYGTIEELSSQKPVIIFDSPEEIIEYLRR